MRAIGGLIAGMVAAAVAMMAVGLVGNMFLAFDGPADPTQREALIAALGSAPLATQLTILFSWFVAALVGAATAKWVARASWPGWTIAIVLALMLAGTFLVPLPMWMQIVAVAGPLVGGVLADMLVRAPTRDLRPPVDA